MGELPADMKSFQDANFLQLANPLKGLQKLAEKMEIPYAKLPMDITEKLGNSDSGTIPAVMTTDVAEDLLSKNNHCCLSGFGGGLTWASIVMDVGNLDFCENIISNL